MKRLIFLLSVFGMLSCTRNVGLERTWQRAGENRAELEKVLRHYEGNDRKHRAALFLLERMADCYSYADSRFEYEEKSQVVNNQPLAIFFLSNCTTFAPQNDISTLSVLY